MQRVLLVDATSRRMYLLQNLVATCMMRMVVHQSCERVSIKTSQLYASGPHRLC
jgi:hypothetical protein